MGGTRENILPETRDGILKQLLDTPGGRNKLVISMVQPLRMRLEFFPRFGQCLAKSAKGTDVEAEPLIIEETAEVPWARLNEGRYGLVERASSLLQKTLGGQMDAHLFALVREAGAPRTEPFPKGWRMTVLSPETFAHLLDAKLLEGSVLEGSVLEGRGRFASRMLRGSLLGPSKRAEPELLYAFGEPAQVGHYSYELGMTDASDETHWRVAAKITLRIALVDEPKAAVYAHELGGA